MKKKFAIAAVIAAVVGFSSLPLVSDAGTFGHFCADVCTPVHNVGHFCADVCK